MSDIVTSLLPIIDSVKKEYTNVKEVFDKANNATGPAATTEWEALKAALTAGNKTLNEAKDEYQKYLDTKKEFDVISAPDDTAKKAAAAAAAGAGGKGAPIVSSSSSGSSGGSNLYSKKNRKSHTASRPHSRRRRTRKHSSASSSHHKKMKFVHHS
jgi:hypothetical protein